MQAGRGAKQDHRCSVWTYAGGAEPDARVEVTPNWDQMSSLAY